MKTLLQSIDIKNAYQNVRSLFSNTQNDISGSSKILYLESVRGIAAMIVVFNHYSELFLPAAIYGPSGVSHQPTLEKLLYAFPFGFLVSGRYAVTIFFILSGFVLTYSYFKNNNQDFILAQMVKRYIRLVIPAAISIFIAHVLLSSGYAYVLKAAEITRAGWGTFQWNFDTTIWLFLYQGFYSIFITGEADLNPVLWTMVYEFFGSFLVLGTAGLFANHKRRWLVYVGLILYFWKTYYLAFILGLILADIFAKESKIRSFLLNLSLGHKIFLLISGLLLGAFPPVTNEIYFTVYDSLLLPESTLEFSRQIWFTIGALFVMVTVLSWSSVQQFLQKKIFVYLGEISFSMYLIHILLIYTVASYIFIKLYPLAGYGLSVLISGVCTISLTIFLSFVWNKYIDKPSILIAKKVGDWFVSKQPL